MAKNKKSGTLVPDLVPDFVKLLIFRLVCREDGIRTHGTVTRTLPFQGSSFNHSDTSLIEDCKNRVIN